MGRWFHYVGWTGSRSGAMRSAQFGHTTVVFASGDKEYSAPCPQGWRPGEPRPVLRDADKVSATFEGGSWAAGGCPVKGTLRHGTFMLHQVTPLMWHLNEALGTLQSRGQLPRLYRGLGGVVLDSA
eukprot:Hpha_TRINITY_DN29358_c0_g1::TRINITY_DN29358_c0_g1_i1::g.112449::m.112449